MKAQNLLFATLLLVISQLMQAQTIDLSSQWRVDYSEWDPFCIYHSYYKDFIDGDTVINSIPYLKVYSSGYSYTEYVPYGFYEYFEHSLHGFLREENNKWYTYDFKYGRGDILLFDFNIGVNDTVFSAYTFIVDQPPIITAVDSIMVDGEYKKRMHLNFEEDEGAEYIIEGIGATSGLFENMVFFQWGSELVCFAKDGISLWGATTEDCDLAVDIGEHSHKYTFCSISPNPCHDYINLSFSKVYNQISFTLINALGKILRQEIIESPTSIRIRMDGYHPGIYFAIIECNSQRQTLKLIIE